MLAQRRARQPLNLFEDTERVEPFRSAAVEAEHSELSVGHCIPPRGESPPKRAVASVSLSRAHRAASAVLRGIVHIEGQTDLHDGLTMAAVEGRTIDDFVLPE